MPSPAQRREESHRRIVDAAARSLRRNGYAGVGVAEVMQQAGLTHGGFYAHFASRQALLAEALAQAGRQSAASLDRRIDSSRARGHGALRALVDGYLSPAHLTGVESGCVVAALGSEMHRQPPALRGPSADRVRALIAKVRRALLADAAGPDSASDVDDPAGAAAAGNAPEDADARATVIASTLVGALQLARALGPGAAGKAVLAAARDSLLAQHDAART